MASEPYIYHLALQSGVGRNLYRAEIAADLLEEQVALLDAAIAAGHNRTVPIERFPALMLGVSRGTSRVARWVICRDGRGALLRAGLALRSPENYKTVPEMWRKLIEGGVHPAAQRMPEMPWYATRLEPGGEHLPPAVLEWAQTLPWAWVERWARQRMP